MIEKKKKKEKKKYRISRVWIPSSLEGTEPVANENTEENITSSMQISTIHASLASHKQAAGRQLEGFAVVTCQHPSSLVGTSRRQYVVSKHARRYERRVSAVPALISGKPPQICPANSGSLSLIVVKKRSEGEARERERERERGREERKAPPLLLALSLCTLFYKRDPRRLIPLEQRELTRAQIVHAPAAEDFSLSLKKKGKRFSTALRGDFYQFASSTAL